jgi:phosphate transport system substrate-binding protein
MVMGGVVPVVNIKGMKAGALKLSNAVLADIFLGKITMWNDPAITKLNTGAKLPEQKITVVHRADGSGTTWIFTNFLDKVSQEWHNNVGTGKSVDWPAGVGGKGNEGVSQYVKKINGAIGYVEFAYALQNRMTHVLLKNKAGKFVAPTIETFQSAAANADWANASGFYMVLTDQPGDNSWPITGASFILIYKEQKDPKIAAAMLKFFDWCYENGAEMAEKLHYVPIPEQVVEQVQTVWKNSVKAGGQPVWK